MEQPASFPVIDHEWNLDDLVGMSEVNEALDAIRLAIETAGSGENIIGDHLTNYNNPHQVTKAQVGLGLVSDFPIASLNEARDGTRNDRYMTASLVKSAISTQVADAFEAHAADRENPTRSLRRKSACPMWPTTRRRTASLRATVCPMRTT